MNHLGALRVSLLIAIGVVPVACGGTVQRGEDGGEGADTGTGNTSTGSGGSGPTKGGAPARAGGPGKMLPPTGGTGTGGGAGTPTCTNPHLDTLSGLIRCSEGYLHRPKPMECSSLGGAPATDDSGVAGEGGRDDADPPVKPLAPEGIPCDELGVGGAAQGSVCDQYERGYCSFVDYGALGEGACKSGCFLDTDCAAGFICECGHAESPTGGECVAATCSDDGDCLPGFYCASSDGVCGGGDYACQTPQDECLTSADCKRGAGACSFNGKYRECEYAACGRPFLVEASARLAPVVASDAWRDPTAPRVQHLTSEQRRELAEHWTRLGQMEHASIAAFARFQLQLLALGAPAALVEQCTRALADETAHTKLCFGMASAYAGHAIGPGPLDVSRSLELTSLADIVELVIAEGCVGETRAALDARAAADSADDPVVTAAYARIAEDEQRHAELAFRFVRWALEQDEAAVRPRIERAVRDLPADAAAQGVTLPCLQALLELTPPAPATARDRANLPAI
jgi:hypothetical protein